MIKLSPVIYYLLDDNNEPVPLSIDVDPESFNTPETQEKYKKIGEIMSSPKRVVAQEHMGDYFISTVFLCIDHNFLGGAPVLWETMVFKDDKSIYEDRYTSYNDSVEGHKFAVQLVKTRKIKTYNED